MNREELRLIEEQTRRVLRDHNIDLNKVCLTQQTMRQAVDDWRNQFSIRVCYMGTMYGSYDVWGIETEEHLMWFRLAFE